MYDAVKHGITIDIRESPPCRLTDPLPFPPEVAAGLHDVGKRGGWNKPALPSHALPTEIWREVIARRKRYEDVRAKLASGEIRSINDLITYNLDIRQFAQDVIENCEGPELLRAFWHAIQEVTVLDPTCGSGAFLFAALNVLEPIYEACLNRMEVCFWTSWIDLGKNTDPRSSMTFVRSWTGLPNMQARAAQFTNPSS